VGGEVIFHDKSMNTVLQNMKLSHKESKSKYVRFMGALPEGVAIVI
jgi:ribulose bisphosphate carboxylase small subunit